VSIQTWSSSAAAIVRTAFVAATLGSVGLVLCACGDDAQKTTGTGGSTSASSAADTASASNSTSATTAASSSTGGMCTPGPTSDPWTTLGPNGGSMTNVIAIGSTVLVSINYGLFRSVDNGQTWASVPLPPSADDFSGFAKTSTEFFASGGYALYRSTDGLTWTDATGTLPDQFAGLNLVQLDGGVAVSDPSGTSPFYRWNSANNDWDDLHSPAVASSTIAATGMDVYVGSSDGDLYASHAGGAYQKLTKTNPLGQMSAAGGSLVLADQTLHPYLSTNGGASFTQTSTTPIDSHLFPTPTGFASVGSQGVFTSKEFWR
jgi:hypothetical protein